VYDGRPRGFVARDIDCDAYGNGVAASWYGFASALPLSFYEWAAGSAPGRDDFMPFTAVGLDTQAVNDTVYPPPGVMLYVTVRANNVAGLSVTASSDGVRILCPPSGRALRQPEAAVVLASANDTVAGNTTAAAGATSATPVPLTCNSDGQGFVCVALDQEGDNLPPGLAFLLPQ